MNAGLDHEKEFSLIDCIKIVFKERFKISICVGIISLLTAGYTLTVDNEYESFAILVSSDKNEINSGQMSSLTSGIGALSILQGNVSENNLTTIALETIQSKVFFENLLLNKDFYSLFIGEENNLSFEQRHRAFLGQLNVVSDPPSPFHRVGFLSTSPEDSFKLVSIIIKDLNNYIRDKEASKASNQIEFLEKVLVKTDNPEIKEIVSSLIRSNIQKQMMSEQSNEFVFTYVDSPRIPENKSKPKRTLTVLLSAFASVILFSLIFIGIDLFRNLKLSDD